jgi:hypothetical protein
MDMPCYRDVRHQCTPASYLTANNFTSGRCTHKLWDQEVQLCQDHRHHKHQHTIRRAINTDMSTLEQDCNLTCCTGAALQQPGNYWRAWG